MMASMAEWHSWDLGSQYSCNAVPIARPSQGVLPCGVLRISPPHREDKSAVNGEGISANTRSMATWEA